MSTRFSLTEEEMRIGLFCDVFPPILDGVSVATKNYAYWLTQMKQQVDVITPYVPNVSDNEGYDVLRFASLPVLGRAPYRLGLPGVDFAFQSQLNRKSFDIIHAHSPFAAGSTGLALARKNNIPLIATFHSKYRDDFERSVRNKFLAKKMTDEVIRFYEQADEVWIPQASVEDTIREYGYKGKIEIVGNGTDFDVADQLEWLRSRARERFGISSGQWMFLFVGQHIWEKNTAMILEALAQLPDMDYKMFFIGDGYAREELKRISSNLGLNSKVTFIGSVYDRDELKQYYAAADLLLFPSIYDNAPLVVREAAAMHTPSVLVDKSCAAEVVTNNLNGFLIPNDARAMASRLRTITKDPGFVKQCGVFASQTIARSWENVMGEVLDRYRSALNRRMNKSA